MPSLASNAPTHLIVKNRVADFDFWKNGFDAHSSARLTAGLYERLILRSTESPEDFFVLFDIGDPVRAREFIHSSDLQDYKKSLAVTAEPQYSFLYESALGKKVNAPAPIRERILSAFAAVDAMDAARFAEHFSTTGCFKFANQVAVTGPTEIHGYVREFLKSIRSISHHIEEILENGSRASVRGTVIYGRHQGTQVEVPFSNFFEVNGAGTFERWQIFIDLTPLHA